MRRIVELEIWSTPERVVVPWDGKAVAQACRTATRLPEDVVLGLNFVPDETDVQILAAKFAKGDASARQFEAFCLDQALPVDSGHAKSAAHFLAFTEGQPLTWLHFPASQEGQGMAASVYEWATTAGHIIRRGQGEKALTETEIRVLWPE